MRKILPALVAALLATTSTIVMAQIEESWPGSPTMVGPAPLAPGGVVVEDDDAITIQDADDDDEDEDDVDDE